MAGITVDTLEQDRKDKLAALDKQYEEDVAVYDNALQDVDEWEQDQREMQNTQTATAVNRINESKKDAEKDYQKEQSAAYTDWQKMSNPYGVEAEKLASSGFTQATGYKGSLQVSMYNTYQNRLATARASYEQTVRDYDRMIEDAYMSNNVVLAEIAAEASNKRLTLTLEAMEYKNALLEELETNKAITNNWYDTYISQLSGTNNTNSNAVVANKIWEQQRSTPGEYGASDSYREDEFFKGYVPQTTVDDGKTFGTFANNYQPKGISGHGNLQRGVNPDNKKEYASVDVTMSTRDGTTVVVEKELWIADDGTVWYWNDMHMRYTQYQL